MIAAISSAIVLPSIESNLVSFNATTTGLKITTSVGMLENQIKNPESEVFFIFLQILGLIAWIIIAPVIPLLINSRNHLPGGMSGRSTGNST